MRQVNNVQKVGSDECQREARMCRKSSNCVTDFPKGDCVACVENDVQVIDYKAAKRRIHDPIEQVGEFFVNAKRQE